MAMMLAAGIQVDDALSLMRGDSGDGPLYDAASAVLERVQMGEPLAEAVEQCGYFPAYAATRPRATASYFPKTSLPRPRG